MGANLTKFNCFKGCRNVNDKSRRSNASVLDEYSRQEHRTSSDIIQELKNIGMISKKTGGVEFFVDIPDEKPRKKKPRRLPAISGPKRQKIKLDTTLKQGNHYDREEKDLMTEIRRIGALAEKGNIARKSEERRQNVLARREENIRRTIRKTEEKLRRDYEQLSLRDKTKKEYHNADKIENGKDVAAVVGEVLPVVSV